MSGAYVALVLIVFVVRMFRLLSRLDRRPDPSVGAGQAPSPSLLGTLSSQARNTADDPRWHERGDQLTGRACADCREKIVVEASAKTCGACGEAVHRKVCAKRHRLEAHPKDATSPYR